MTAIDGGKANIRIGIVDDERLARERLQRLVLDAGNTEIVIRCADGIEAIASIIELQPDVVFLDVNMSGCSGLDVARSVHEALGDDRAPLTVFVTAHDEHAVKAFESQAVDYLVKPFDDARFTQAIERVRKRISERRIGAAAMQLSALVRGSVERAADVGTSAEISRGNAAEKSAVSPNQEAASVESETGTLDRIVVRIGSVSRIVRAETVNWIEAEGIYSRLHIRDDSFLIRIAMHQLEARLDPHRFVRIHRSTIVNLDWVREVYASDNTVVLLDGTVRFISRSRRAQLERMLGQSL